MAAVGDANALSGGQRTIVRLRPGADIQAVLLDVRLRSAARATCAAASCSVNLQQRGGMIRLDICRKPKTLECLAVSGRASE